MLTVWGQGIHAACVLQRIYGGIKCSIDTNSKLVVLDVDPSEDGQIMGKDFFFLFVIVCWRGVEWNFATNYNNILR